MTWNDMEKTNPAQPKPEPKPVVQTDIPKGLLPPQVAVKPPSSIFTPAKEVVQRAGLKIAVHGKYKTGKTHLALTFPAPIYIIDTQFGIAPVLKNSDGTLRDEFKDKEIYVLSVFEEDPASFEADPTKSLNKIEEAVTSLKQSGLKIGTIVVDDVTDVWKWVQGWMRMEILKLDQGQRIKQQWDWQYANAKYQNLIMKLLSVQCNLILNAQEQQEYVEAGSPSANWLPVWQKQTPYWVDIVLGMGSVLDKGTLKYFARIEAFRGENRKVKSHVGTTIYDIDYAALIKVLEGK